MKLNHNSFSAKFYRWFFMQSEMPSNLCPYFWKLVLAYTLSIPVLVVTSIYEIICMKDQKNKPADTPGERFILGILAWVVLFIIVCLISPIALFWTTPEKDSSLWNLITSGILIWIGAIIIGIVLGIKHIKEKRDEAKWKKKNRHNVYDEHGNWVGYHHEEPKPNILLEFIKAKYNKYCPKIEWKR